MRTYMPKKETITRKWFHVNAEGTILGRLATRIATVLMGKNKTVYAPHMDCGDYIVVTNAEKVRVTGKKREQKRYYRDSQYLGGLRSDTMGELFEKKPEMVLYYAVKRMLPKTTLGRAMLKKLKIYSGETHPHAAQKPEELTIKTR